MGRQEGCGGRLPAPRAGRVGGRERSGSPKASSRDSPKWGAGGQVKKAAESGPGEGGRVNSEAGLRSENTERESWEELGSRLQRSSHRRPLGPCC